MVTLVATIGGRRFEFPARFEVADVISASIYENFPEATQIEVVLDGKVIDRIERS